MVEDVEYKIAPKDIRSFGLQCSNCNAEVRISIDSPHPPPKNGCAVCGQIWPQDPKLGKVLQFISLLKELKVESGHHVKVRLVLKLDPE